MGMVPRMKTTSKLPIPEGITEAGLLFHYDIVSKVKRHKILDALTLNLDQTTSEYVTFAQTTLAKKNSKSVATAGGSDKRSITATFVVLFDGTFRPVQLIYGGKTTQSLPKFSLPCSFSLSVNPTKNIRELFNILDPTHYSNENEPSKMTDENIPPYVKSVMKKDKLPVD